MGAGCRRRHQPLMTGSGSRNSMESKKPECNSSLRVTIPPRSWSGKRGSACAGMFYIFVFGGGLDEAFGLIVGAVLAVGGYVRSANTQDHSASRNCDPCGESVGYSHGKLSYGPIDLA